MPVIKVWCLPEMEEDKLRQIHKDIVQAVVSVKELGLNGERDMTCLFPKDMMEYGLGEEIIVEVTGLFERPERTEEVRSRLAECLGKVLKQHFPKAMVECFVFPFDPKQGFWTSEKEETPFNPHRAYRQLERAMKGRGRMGF